MAGWDDIVVRGGIATLQQLQRGIAEHACVLGLTGFSVQSAAGKTVDELATAGQFRNRQVSVTTVGEVVLGLMISLQLDHLLFHLAQWLGLCYPFLKEVM